jgi:hypothetical protein
LNINLTVSGCICKPRLKQSKVSIVIAFCTQRNSFSFQSIISHRETEGKSNISCEHTLKKSTHCDPIKLYGENAAFLYDLLNKAFIATGHTQMT